MKNKILILLLVIFTISFESILQARPKFTDRQVAMMIPKYFARDHNSPEITRTRIYGDNGKKILHLNIAVNRNRYEGQMEYAFGAMASISQYASRPFDTFILIMETNSRQFQTEKVEAKARCTIDYFVHKRVKISRWSKQCIDIEKI
tara:strand:+ start:2443 stop:2883 length:441 start_codon:yes stop_codon:yes gene_type:complete